MVDLGLFEECENMTVFVFRCDQANLVHFLHQILFYVKDQQVVQKFDFQSNIFHVEFMSRCGTQSKGFNERFILAFLA